MLKINNLQHYVIDREQFPASRNAILYRPAEADVRKKSPFVKGARGIDCRILKINNLQNYVIGSLRGNLKYAFKVDIINETDSLACLPARQAHSDES